MGWNIGTQAEFQEDGGVYAECWSTGDAFCALAKATYELEHEYEMEADGADL